MIKYLVKSSNELRIETKDEVDSFHKELEQEAAQNGYVLSAWSENKKEKKAKGEIIDEYYQVKYTFTFNDIKDPERPSGKIEYNFFDTFGMVE